MAQPLPALTAASHSACGIGDAEGLLSLVLRQTSRTRSFLSGLRVVAHPKFQVRSLALLGVHLSQEFPDPLVRVDLNLHAHTGRPLEE